MNITPFHLILSSLGREFNYDDIPKRSMLSDTQQYTPLVSKVAMALNIPIYPSLDELVKRYGGERFKERIKDRLEKYRYRMKGCFDSFFYRSSASKPPKAHHSLFRLAFLQSACTLCYEKKAFL